MALQNSFEHQWFVKKHMFSMEGFQFWLIGGKIQSHFRKKLRRNLEKQTLRRYLYGKQLIGWNAFPLIDWEMLGKFMNIQTQEFKLWNSNTLNQLLQHWEDDESDETMTLRFMPLLETSI